MTVDQAYVGESTEDKPHKRNSVRLAIRKVNIGRYIDSHRLMDIMTHRKIDIYIQDLRQIEKYRLIIS